MDFWLAIAIIAVAGIISGIIYTIVTSNNKTKQYIAAVQAGIEPGTVDSGVSAWGNPDWNNAGAYKQQAEEAAKLNKQVIERLTALEIRLGNIERTLNEIP